ncbi:hypothetical protein FO519_008988 [Halicephalobus sp. NKZ332]|nr:hypothetical protein FO519_008988 [Halicephalobus sp. NKZ332]
MAQESLNRFMKSVLATFLSLLLFTDRQGSAAVIELTDSNIDAILQSHQLVFVNFYADWCRFSQHLKPIFEESSNQFTLNTAGQIAFASVDCDKQPGIAQKYHVNKYPTLKMFRYGEAIKKEYRGQRSMDALSDFVKKQIESTVKHFTSPEDLSQNIDAGKRNIIGYFTHPSGEEYANFQKIASALRDDCVFWLGTGDWVGPHTKTGNAVYFKAEHSNENFEYTGPLQGYEYLRQWMTDKCVPLVREITFENAEEMTEEGLPFLLLFRKEGDSAAEQVFKDAVVSELGDDLKKTVNCLMADGKKFAHPLHHLGKSEKDLPLIAIDSFRHMYLLGDFSKLGVPGELRKFIQDLHSGKLHREFHNGPDPTQPPAHGNAPSNPPESVFKKLEPSENRYTILKKTEL